MNSAYLTNFFLILFIVFGCNKQPKLYIAPISPYQYYARFNERDIRESKQLFFTYKDIGLSESIILQRLHHYIKKNYKTEFDSVRPSTEFLFYEYKKDGIDENFRNDFSSESKNIFQIASPTYVFQWSNNEFLYIKKTELNGSITLIDTLGIRIENKTNMSVKEVTTQ